MRRLEDNAFLLLRSAEGRVAASLQASWTQWKNLFSTGSVRRKWLFAGPRTGRQLWRGEIGTGPAPPQGGAPEIKEIDFHARPAAESQDDVWAREWQAFVNEFLGRDHHRPRESAFKPATAIDAWEALRIVEAVYGASRTAAIFPPRRHPQQIPRVLIAAPR